MRADAVLAAAGGEREAFDAVRRARSSPSCAAGRPPTAATGPPSALRGRAVVLVDDGLATGATMRAAVVAVRRQAPAAHHRRRPDRLTDRLRRARRRTSTSSSASRRRASFRAVGQAYADFAADQRRRGAGGPRATAPAAVTASTGQGVAVPFAHTRA